MSESPFPTAEASRYPVLGEIVGEIEIEEDGTCAMPAERFKFWAGELWKKFPRKKNPDLYGMLGGMSLEFAKKKAFASIQLFALATMGLPAPEVDRAASQSAFLASEESRKASDTLKIKANPTAAGGMAPPTAAGASLRPGRKK